MMKYLHSIVLLTLFSTLATASEPTHAVLAEIVKPMAVQLPATVEDLADEAPVQEQQTVQTDLFTLDELKENADKSADLDLNGLDLQMADIPLALNSKVEYFIYYFQTKGKPAFSRWLSHSSRYIPLMKEILKKEGMPEDLVYVAMIESGFQLHARSVANAVGPWQFISDTGRRYSLRIDQWIDERKNPVKATVAAGMYLKELYGLFKGDWYLAAAGYNAGENKILRAISKYNTSDFWEISQGSYLKRETKEYVPKLLAAAIIAKDPARYGFSDIAYLPPIEFDTAILSTRTDLELVARLSGTNYETIKELNPELKHWCTPPNYPDFKIKLPKGAKQLFEAELAKIPEDQRYTERILYTHYHPRKKETLHSIARKFGTTPETIIELNNLNPRKLRYAGASLIVPAKQTVDFTHEGRDDSVSKGRNKSTLNRYYTVKKGDTIENLARRFNISAKMLSAWNNLKDKVALKPGRRLIVAKFIEKNGQMKAPKG